MVCKTVPGSIPVLFLHGVYLDCEIWSYHVHMINDRTVIAIDMPFHGRSREIRKRSWTLDDCSVMLIELMDALGIEKASAIGHSWGSMTILRAAVTHPERFVALGLCNMPYQRISSTEKWMIRLQHIVLMFRGFYLRQVAMALIARNAGSDLVASIVRSMSILSNAEIRHTDKAVRLDAQDATPLLMKLVVPTLALRGKEDYVGSAPMLETIVVGGGHVSPIEVPNDVCSFIGKVLRLNVRRTQLN